MAELLEVSLISFFLLSLLIMHTKAMAVAEVCLSSSGLMWGLLMVILQATAVAARMEDLATADRLVGEATVQTNLPAAATGVTAQVWTTSVHTLSSFGMLTHGVIQAVEQAHTEVQVPMVEVHLPLVDMVEVSRRI